MSDGRTHFKISVRVGAALGIGALVLAEPADAAAFVSGLVWATFVTPDLDVDGGNITSAKIRRLSRPAALLWRFATWPYGKLFNHRGSSHAPFWGTAVRIAYFAVVPLATFLFFYDVDVDVLLEHAVRPLLMFFLAASLIDIAHIITDHVSTAWKKFWTRWRKKRSPAEKTVQKLFKKRTSLHFSYIN